MPFTRFLPDLLRRHSGFRNLWLSQLVSNFGDWFAVLAAYDLILRNSGSEWMLGAFIVTKMVSFAVFSPLGGYVADRFNRRHVMMVSDLGRALVVLLFLFADGEGLIWLLFAGTAVQMGLAAVFEPARGGLTPDMLKPEDLPTANVISSATWSIIFAAGMGIGGVATGWFGSDAVFLFDAATYLVSAWFIRRIPEPGVQQKGSVTANPLQGITEGWRYVHSRPGLLFPVLVKAASSLFIGGLVYTLVLVGDRKLAMGSAGVGLLYMSRGVGTAFGPVWARRLFRDSRRWMSAFGLFIVTGGLFYAACGFSASVGWLLVFVFGAHAASAACWVLSTVLVQERAELRFRGRVTGMEWLGFTVTNSVSTLAVSGALDAGWLELDAVLWLLGGGMAVFGLGWMVFMARRGEVSWWAPAGAQPADGG